ncbi:MAG: HET-C-related protein [Chloroflexota bacterium]
MMHTFDKKPSDHSSKHTPRQESAPAVENDLPESFNDLPQREQQSTILRMQQTRGNAYMLRQLQTLQRTPAKPTLSPARRGMIQRYQAGEKGHGGIEERTFTSIGFSDEEASAIYFGNWLRDFSQLNSSGHNNTPPDAFFDLISILGYGEFNRPVTREELGTYVPSEHLDNPDAGGLNIPKDKQDTLTVEDPAIQALANLPDTDPRKDPFKEAFKRLSPQQQDAFWAEEGKREEITKNAKRSGLPEYIERGKLHTKTELERAITAPADKMTRNERLSVMGGALHAVEDYFSHSNFVEVGLWTLYNEGNKDAEPYVKQMVERMNGTNPALIGGAGPDGQPKILTGTYSPGANNLVSDLELLKVQLQTGEFAKAFVVGLIRMGTVTAAQIAEILGIEQGGTIGGSIGYVAGGIGGAVGGAVEGAQTGASQGFDEGASQGYQNGYQAAGGGIPGEALGQAEGVVEGAVGGVTGFFKGAAQGLFGGASRGSTAGARAGAQFGGDVGGSMAKGLVDANGKLVLTVAQIDMLIGGPLIKAKLGQYLPIIEKMLEDASVSQTQKSAEQAAERGVTGPTHSQIAKDAPDHPLFGVSVKLAEFADREIGQAMKAALDSGNTDDGTVKPIQDLVDKFISDPSKDGWWHETLAGALKPDGS